MNLTWDFGELIGALVFAAERHRDQRRKDRFQTPYVNHLLAVVDILWNVGGERDRDTLLAGVLHDIVEDTATRESELAKRFGAAVAGIVAEVSDDKTLPKAERKRLQVVQSPHKSAAARRVKIADATANVRDLVDNAPAGWSNERQLDYVRWARAVIAGIRDTSVQMECLFDESCSLAEAAIRERSEAPPTA
ncbi:MAG: HD domain-containing protein [Candidatus Schekmanbacteria bacterium]|nr:HD domain-containing protein [Candidatus Schekmanbacteria bacterium]